MTAQGHLDVRQSGRRYVAGVATAALVGGFALVGGGAANAGSAAQTLAVRSEHDSRQGASREHVVWSRFVDLDFSAARIMVGAPNGAHKRRLTHPRAGVIDLDPKISPNGRLVAFERDDIDGNGHLMVVGINGRGLHEVDVCADPCFSANQPTWSPDGRHLVFTRVDGPIDSNGNAAAARLWKTDLQGQHVVPVSNPRIDGKFEDAVAQFAPAGYIVFVRLNLARDDAAVFRMNPDGSHACRLTPWSLNADLPDVSPATGGPTENLAVFETYGHGGPPPGKASAIATVRASCGGEHHIRYLTSPASDPVWHFNPGWSPDGSHVVFVRFKSVEGDPVVHGDIQTARWTGEHRRTIARSKLFDFRPDWGPAPRD